MSDATIEERLAAVLHDHEIIAGTYDPYVCKCQLPYTFLSDHRRHVAAALAPLVEEMVADALIAAAYEQAAKHEPSADMDGNLDCSACNWDEAREEWDAHIRALATPAQRDALQRIVQEAVDAKLAAVRELVEKWRSGGYGDNSDYQCGRQHSLEDCADELAAALDKEKGDT